MERTPTTRWRFTAAAAVSTLALALPGLVAQAGPAAATPDRQDWTTLTTTAARTDGPLEGFIPFAPEPGTELQAADPDFPYELEWFYLPVDAVVVGEDRYDWTRFESWLDSVADRGHQSAFRFYLDYPGQETGVPDYLLGADGISQDRRYDFYDNNGISFSPDYDDPRVVELLTDFIAELGERYDGDPRIGYVTAGLIGFWGESHTYPVEGEVDPVNNPDGVTWMPSTTTQAALWEAWDEAMDETWVQARYPDELTAQHDLGYHDDSWAYATLPTTDWHFLGRMERAGLSENWKHAPVGGELYPPLQTCIFSEPLSCPGAEGEIAGGRDYDVDAALQATHATWIINHRAWTVGYQGEDRERALAAHAALGHDLAATSTRTVVDARRGVAEVSVRVNNRGVAPFAYDWPVELSLLGKDGRELSTGPADVDLTEVLPGDTVEVSAELPLPTRWRGLSMTTAMHVPNPMDGGAPVRFANETQDRHAEGWLSLDKVTAADCLTPCTIRR